MLDQILQTVREEMSDLGDAAGVTRVVLRLAVAGTLGGLLGYERETSGKSAGLRTHILVALGSALYVLVPQQAGVVSGDVSRVIQGLVAGIGFLGAGAIIHNSRDQAEAGASEEGEVKGLTTAANIWMTAAIGMAAGLGREVTAILSAAFALFVLSALPKVFGKIAPPRKRKAAAERGID